MCRLGKAKVLSNFLCPALPNRPHQTVYQIADILSEEKVLCPSAYLAAKGVGNRRNSKFEDPYRWWGTTVSYVLIPWFTKHFGKKNTYIYVHVLGAVVPMKNTSLLLTVS